MDKKNKAISIILYILWPFSSITIGIKNFDYAFGRKLLIATFVFLGFTTNATGDLERYASQYYDVANMSLNQIIDLFLQLQISKLFNSVTSILFSPFDNHHVYFAFLFGFYGYFLVNSINMLRLQLLRNASPIILISFIAFALYFSLLTIYNYAFYSGAIYFVYFLLQIILYKRKSAYFLILFTPLFHFGLAPLLLVPIFYLFFKQKTYLYIILLIVCATISQTAISNTLELYLAGNDTILDSKIKVYASQQGIENMNTRYESAYSTRNLNYKIFTDVREYTNQFAIPLFFVAMFLNIRTVRKNKLLLNLFNISLGAWAITQLMLNISQGTRFSIISGFLVLGSYVFYIQKFGFKNLKFKSLIYIGILMVLLNNIVSLVLITDLINSDFIFFNFPILFFKFLYE